MDAEFLLKTYGQCYDAEAGPWNLSVENKYLEYMFTKFFTEQFIVDENSDICNIGIGAGYWDRFLSYQLKRGTLTSIDRDEVICRQLREGLRNERNPSTVIVCCCDIMDYVPEYRFDIVTMIGSTRMESGRYDDILRKVFSLVKPGGSLYYQTLDPQERPEEFRELAEKSGFSIQAYLLDGSYGFHAQYWKAQKR